MKITPDTNVLIRTILLDDKQQAAIASQILKSAQTIAISLPCLCEIVWVLLRNAKLSREEVSAILRDFLDSDVVIMNRAAVRYGLTIHDAGGDFSDAIIAHEGERLGAKTFISFDQQAVKLLSQHGHRARLLQ